MIPIKSLAAVPVTLMALALPGMAQDSTATATADTTEQTATDQTTTDTAVAEPVTDENGVIEMSIGAEDAPVTIVEYASFTCPHCANWHDQVWADLKADYIDSGKVKFVLREVYFDRPGLWAGMVARCAGPVRYFGITDMLFDEQSDWTSGGQPAQIAEGLRKIGLKAGLEPEQLDACLQDGEKAQALVATFESTTQADDISATPTFLINGEKHSNMNYADMKELIDAELPAN
ncbi:MAG: DsbA family protein [Celeribacter sp.]